MMRETVTETIETEDEEYDPYAYKVTTTPNAPYTPSSVNENRSVYSA